MLCDMLTQYSAQIETTEKLMKKYFYFLGILLIILACLDLYILGLLMYGDYLLGIIGIVLILLSNQKFWIKLLTILLLPPIVILSIIFFIFQPV